MPRDGYAAASRYGSRGVGRAHTARARARFARKSGVLWMCPLLFLAPAAAARPSHEVPPQMRPRTGMARARPRYRQALRGADATVGEREPGRWVRGGGAPLV